MTKKEEESIDFSREREELSGSMEGSLKLAEVKVCTTSPVLGYSAGPVSRHLISDSRVKTLAVN